MPGIKSNSIHFPFLTCFFNVLKLTLCFTDVSIMISLTSSSVTLRTSWADKSLLSRYEQSDINICYYSEAFWNLWIKKKTHMKTSTGDTDLVPVYYLGDNCILLKKIRFNISAKHKEQSGPSSVFVVTVPVLPAMFPKQDVCCGWWRKRQSTVQMGTLGFWVSVQTIWSGITEGINRELYTVGFMVLLFRTYFKYVARCQMSANQWAPPASDGAALTFKTWNKAVDLWQ